MKCENIVAMHPLMLGIVHEACFANDIADYVVVNISLCAESLFINL